jgi:hypothetical protein
VSADDNLGEGNRGGLLVVGGDGGGRLVAAADRFDGGGRLLVGSEGLVRDDREGHLVGG